MKTLREQIEFDWDVGNSSKSEQRHGISDIESEEAFFDRNKIIYKDVFHSVDEDRYIVIGRTNMQRLLYVVFTYRGKKIRIISARVINKKEVYLYEKKA